MILVGSQRGGAKNLALHLMQDENERVEVHELRGFVAGTLKGAFQESYAISRATNCRQHLFSVSFNPPKDADVNIEDFEAAIDRVEMTMGLEGQPRAIVFHEKCGIDGILRRHAHAVWCRIDAETLTAKQLSFSHRKLNALAHALFLEHGWELPKGFLSKDERDPLNFALAEAQQAKRAEKDPNELKRLFQQCWAVSDSRAAFAHALEERGYILARGDRRGFVAIDSEGEVYSISRWVGVKAREVCAKLGEPDDLPTVSEAIALHQQAPQPQPITQQHDSDIERVALLAKQEQERTALQAAQNARRLTEIKARQKRLPQGMRGIWSRLNGTYVQIAKEIKRDVQIAARRDRAETASLLARHRTHLQNLDRKGQSAIQELEQAFGLRSDQSQHPRYAPDPRQPLILPREPLPFKPDRLARRPDLILAHISAKQARFTRTDVLRALADHISDPIKLGAAADQALTSNKAVKLEDGAWTTRDYQDAANAVMETATSLRRSGGFGVASKITDKAIKRQNADLSKRYDARLSAEQVAGIKLVLGPEQLATVVGLAGAGKSTMLAAAREAWEKDGYRVRGATLAGKAADSLQTASGIPSRTLASLEASWEAGYEPVGHGDVLVVDEAGMVGTRQMARITRECRTRGCKLVLIGDPISCNPSKPEHRSRTLSTRSAPLACKKSADKKCCGSVKPHAISPQGRQTPQSPPMPETAKCMSPRAEIRPSKSSSRITDRIGRQMARRSHD